jgi:cytochrome b6-f complex iron-sulfur subunit
MAEDCSRRGWLLTCLQSCIAVTFAALLYPVVRFLKPRKATQSGALVMVAPYRMDQLKPNAEGHWPPPFNFGGKPCLLILVDGEPRAFNAVCTHVQCTVEYRPVEGDMFCNCHNGVYDINGRNVSGPPPRPLEMYKTIKGKGDPGQEEIIVSKIA